MSKPTFGQLMEMYRERFGVKMAPNAELKNRAENNAYSAALTERLGLECQTFTAIEARIARWEALERLHNSDPLVYNAVHMALERERSGERAQTIGSSTADVLSRLDRAAAQALQPTINAKLGKATAECAHEWTPLYTDRDSPQSYVNGVYRGYKVVGEKCQRCGENKLDEPVPATAECACGGPAGHVPHGLLCRKGMR